MHRHRWFMVPVLALMGICLFLAPAALAKEAKLAVSPLPTDFANMKINPQDIHALPYAGIFQRKVKVDGVERAYTMYIPAGSRAASPVVFAVPEAGRDPLEFLERSGWKDIADKHKIMLFVPEAPDRWNVQAGENDYLNAILADTRKRTYFLSYSPNYYLVGYGDGAVIAQEYAMANPAAWAGLATFGAAEVPDQYRADAGNKPSDSEYVPMKEVPLPVWCVVPELSGQTEKTIQYWRQANRSAADAYANQYAQYIYFPAQPAKTSQVDDENIAKVMVTMDKQAGKYNQRLAETIWSGFLSKTRRYLGIANGDLRSYAPPEQLGAVKKSVEVDGYTRVWYEYVPASVKANLDKAVPLVIAMHGRSGTGEEFVGRGGWLPVAEERGFIVVCPSGGITLKHDKAVPNTVWNVNNGDVYLDDVKFLKQMLESIKENHKIDSGRIYATGQSMGSMMSYSLALQLPELFAAVGSTSGPPIDMVFNKGVNINTQYDIPFMLVAGDKDVYFDYESDPLVNAKLHKQLDYWIKRYDTNPIDQPATYQCGPYHHRIYYDKAGIPMVHYVNVNNLVHANVPHESWMIYDEFLCKFYRDEKGKVVYENGQQERQQINRSQMDESTAPVD